MTLFAPGRKAVKASRAATRALCVEKFCGVDRKHGRCSDCGDWTCTREQRVEPVSLRRVRPLVCTSCLSWMPGNERRRSEQELLRQQRTERDWAKVSTPIEADALLGDVMPEQYASKARAAVRAFFDAGFDVAAVRDSDSATLNSSIRTLGLEERVYAETRDGVTVLRRSGSDD